MKKNQKNKKILIIIFIFILTIILGIIFSKNMIKNSKNGNNMSSQEIVDYILNLNYYKSTVTINVNSNKNNNKYILKQEFNLENGCTQEVIEPANIAGVKITKKDGNLVIENSSLDLSKIFENYNELEENFLDLSSFINDYKNYDKSNFEEKENIIIMRTKNNTNNKYIQNKTLYINKENKKPSKLIIEDNNKNVTVNIEYNEIELN